MRIGIPREIKADEHRVGLIPATVRELTSRGHHVLVEAGAGAGSGFPDHAYEAAGASLAPDAGSVFETSDLIVKVKEPQRSEWERLTEKHILFTYLHLAPDPAQADGLLKSGCAAIAYETVTEVTGGLPLLAPMSEIAGRLSVLAAAQHLQKHHGGMGLLFPGAAGSPAAQVTVLGGGMVGTNAARMALGLGAQVTIVERSVARLRALDEMFGGRVRTRHASMDAVEVEILGADVVIGAVLAPGAAAPHLLRREHLARMTPGAVIVDVAIDQGGCFETSRPTTHHEPTFILDGIVHYCVANMPGAVPKTASEALGAATLPYVLKLADKGLSALAEDRFLAKGLNVARGEITHPAVAQALGRLFSDPYAAWS